MPIRLKANKRDQVKLQQGDTATLQRLLQPTLSTPGRRKKPPKQVEDCADFLRAPFRARGFAVYDWPTYQRERESGAPIAGWPLVVVHEFHFASAPDPDWRNDWALPAYRLAIEVDGGRWESGGGHHMTEEDYRKTNRLVCFYGWRLWRCLAETARERPIQVVDDIVTVLCELYAEGEDK